MGEKDQEQLEDDDLSSLDDFDDDGDFDDPSIDIVKEPENKEAEEERRRKARRAIEKKNELKALRSELDEWDEPFDENDL